MPLECPPLQSDGLRAGEANDDSSSVPRHARSLERTAAVRSRRIMGRLARSSSLSSSEEEEQEEEGKEEESEVKEEPVASLPVWTGRRPRSIPSKLSKADKPKQVPISLFCILQRTGQVRVNSLCSCYVDYARRTKT